MPLPKWATDKSNTDVIETKEDRALAEQIKKTIAKENADPELSLHRVGITPDRSSGMLQASEVQYEGNTLDYHGYN